MMEIVFQAHHANVSERMRRKAESSVRRIAKRSGRRPVDAVIRFEGDGPARRVELVLHTPRGRRYVARSEARFFGPALAGALRRLSVQMTRTKRVPKARAAKLVRAGAA